MPRYLGPHQRASQGVLTSDTRESDDAVNRAAGFCGPRSSEVPGFFAGHTAEEIATSVHSLSGSTYHLFSDQVEAPDADLCQLLAAASPNGCFSEQGWS